MSKTTDSLSSTCVLCCQGIKIYAVGPCNHHICFKCSTKMRVICNQMYCAVCRTEMPKAIFTNKVHPFEGIISHKFPHDRKYGIFFASSRIQEEYRKILANRCYICGIRRMSDDTFKQLQDHMRKEHELFACQLCVDHIKVLSSERRFYNRKELAVHRRSGDPDDKSYRGHPHCRFCDDRYFDNDELQRHLRKDHYYCHFCEKDGIMNEYYGEYRDLADHFRSDHYLCEEDGCLGVEFTTAFRTDIDLKAHKARVHSGRMTKIQARQTRQVDVEINLPARPREFNRGRRDGAYGGGARGGRDRYRRERNDRETGMALEASLQTAQREDMEREKKKKTISKAKNLTDDMKSKRTHTDRSDSPTENMYPGNETRAHREEDKENETSGAPLPAHDRPRIAVSTAAPYASNVARKPPGMGDFPTLGGQTAAPAHTGGKWSAAPPQREEDFPALGNGDGGAGNAPLNVASSFGFYSSLLGNKGPLTTQSVEPACSQAQPAWAQPVSNEGEEFPTLSSIASLLGGNQKNVNKPKKKKKGPASQAKIQNDSANIYIKANTQEKAFSTVVEDKKEVGIKGKREKKETGKVKNMERKETSKEKNEERKETGKVKIEERKETARGKNEDVKKTAKEKSEGKKAPVPDDKPALPSQMPPPANSTLSSSTAASSSAARPPPGFAALLQTSSSSVPSNPPPGFAALPLVSAEPEFVPPPNFKERNRELVYKIQDFCSGKEDLFAQFKQDSGEFRQGMITASEYYQRCMQTLSEENFLQIFNELVSLLPDVVKQQELLIAHNDYKVAGIQLRQDKVLKISNTKPGKKTAWRAGTSKADSSRCPVCSQVVMATDMAEHMNVHEDFPALSSSQAPRQPGGIPAKTWSNATWGRGK